MAKVVNNIVKMDWEKEGWLQTKASRGNQGTFIMASKEYENEDGKTIPVIFNSETAFIWGNDIGSDEEDIWDVSELRSWLKGAYDSAFPESYDEYFPIIPSGSLEAIDSVLEQFGLTAHKADIEARLKDLLPYNEEIELTGM